MLEEKTKPSLDSEISTKEKFQKLSFKKKIEFIYDYYKLPIALILIGIIMTSSFLFSITTKQDIYCNITYWGSSATPEELSNIKNNLNKNILYNNKKSSIFIDSIFINQNSNYGDDPTSTEVFAVKLAANELDLLLLNKNTFDYLSHNNMLLDLNLLNGFSSLNINEKDLIIDKDTSNNEHLYGIKTNNLNLLKSSISNLDDTILAVAISSQRQEAVLQILEELIKQ